MAHFRGTPTETIQGEELLNPLLVVSLNLVRPLFQSELGRLFAAAVCHRVLERVIFLERECNSKSELWRKVIVTIQ